MKPQAESFVDANRPQASVFTLLLVTSTLVACAQSPQKVAMPDPKNTGQSSRERDSKQAVPEVIPPATVTKTTAPDLVKDTPAAAVGRRTLSTAFVRIGPDGHLTVALLDGRVIVLRDVVMGPKDYCGVLVAGNSARTQYCGGYAEIAAARSGGGEQPDSEVSNAGEPARGPKGE